MSKSVRSLAWSVFAVALAAPSGLAQNVLVVDRNGSGAFLDIPPAIAAAAPGDVIVVRPGAYTPFAIDKPLAVLGDPGAQLLTQQLGVLIRGIGLGQQVVVRGLTFQSTTLPSTLVVDSCPGLVVVEDVVAGGMQVSNSGQIAFRNVAAGGVVSLTDANLTIDGGTLAGSVVCTRSRVTIAGALVLGRFTLGFPAPGLDVRSGRVIAMGDTTRIETGPTLGLASPAVTVAAGAQFVVDPAVVLVAAGGAPGIQGAAQVVALNALTVTRAASVVAARTYALGANQAHLLVSLPRQPVLPLPLPFGDLWASDVNIVLDSGPLGATGVRTASIPFPALQPGLPLVFQSIVLRGSSFEFSNPTVVSF